MPEGEIPENIPEDVRDNVENVTEDLKAQDVAKDNVVKSVDEAQRQASLEQYKRAAERTLQSSVKAIKSIGEAIGGFDAFGPQVDPYFKEYHDAYTNLRDNPNPQAEDYKSFMETMKKYSDAAKMHNDLIQKVGTNSISRTWTKFSNLFEPVSSSLGLKQKLTEVSQPLSDLLDGKIDRLPENFPDKVREAGDLVKQGSDKFDKDNKEEADKAKANWGETAYKYIKLLAMLAALGGSLYLLFHVLPKEFSGCYQIVTGGTSTKLSCQYSTDDQPYCSCGGDFKPATKVDRGGTECTTGDKSKYPPCNCTGITCSADITSDGAISYNYEDVGPLEALGLGLGSLIKPLADDTGLADLFKNLGKYLKYILIVVAVIAGLVVLLKAFEIFSSHGSGHENVQPSSHGFRFRKTKKNV